MGCGCGATQGKHRSKTTEAVMGAGIVEVDHISRSHSPINKTTKKFIFKVGGRHHMSDNAM